MLLNVSSANLYTTMLFLSYQLSKNETKDSTVML